MTVPHIELNSGAKMPMIGLGTWRVPKEIATQNIKDAIDIGYRHIDCALIYGNEAEIGVAIEEKIKEEVVKREELFITSKLWCTFHHPKSVRVGCERSLKDLRLNYLDNYLIHWPMGYKEGEDLRPTDESGNLIFSDDDYVDTWRAMEELVDAGLVRSIGISNFNQSQIERILAIARIKPAILQIECHPYLSQAPMMEFCRSHSIAITAYSPLGSPGTDYVKPGDYPIMQHPKVIEISQTHDRQPAEVLLRYQLQRGNAIIPRATGKAHLEANFGVCSFTLTEDDMLTLNSLNFNGRIMLLAVAFGHPHHPYEHETALKDTTAKVENLKI